MFGGLMHGFWGIGWLIGLLLFMAFTAGFVIFTIWAVRQISNNNAGTQRNTQNPRPGEILKARYARGEISRQEFEQMREDLERI